MPRMLINPKTGVKFLWSEKLARFSHLEEIFEEATPPKSQPTKKTKNTPKAQRGKFSGKGDITVAPMELPNVDDL